MPRPVPTYTCRTTSHNIYLVHYYVGHRIIVTGIGKPEFGLHNHNISHHNMYYLGILTDLISYAFNIYIQKTSAH